MTARIGIVGVGWWATFNHIPTIQSHPDATLVAICDVDQDRLAIAGDKFAIDARYDDLFEMLHAERLDGVIVSTPHTQHTQPALASLEAGAHVLIEKPMATMAADGRAIAQAARQAGRQVMVPTGLNFEDYSAVAHRWVREGRIGKLRHATCQMGSPLHDLFAGQPMHETKDHLFRPPPSTWADPQNAGGYAWGQMSHSIAWLTYVTDTRFERAYCISGQSKAGVDIYDAAVVRTKTGATFMLSGAATVPKHKGMHTDVRLYGTQGMISFDNQKARVELARLDGQDDQFETSDRSEYDGTLPVRVFADLCAGHDVVNASDGECGAEVTALIHALYRSAASGQPEDIE